MFIWSVSTSSYTINSNQYYKFSAESMTSQGLRASPEGIRAAKTALIDQTLSQHKLAIALGITRQPVSKFFAGEPVSRSCFVQICQKLGLSWQKIAGLPEEEKTELTSQIQSNNVDLLTLVQRVRQKRQDKIHDQCSTLQMLDIASAIPLSEIYTNVSVVEEISSQQWREISDLMNDFSLELNFNRLGTDKHQRKLPGLEAASQYSKLMVLGKPGSGKTTFLQYLANECNKGDFQTQRIAIFISLKELAEDTKFHNEFNVLNYISQEFLSCGIDEESTITLLTEGKAMILLDGLDEVPSNITETVTREIRRFCQCYYKNQFIISCRTAAHKYRFPGFTEVEIADFDHNQIKVFVKNWFVVVARQSREDGEATGNLFINQLNSPANKPILELAVTPMLLHLICLVFNRKFQFPDNPAKLYDKVLNSLLVRWDEIRGIKRNHFKCDLTLTNKKKLLSQIAVVTLEQGDYFFEHEKIQQIIYEFLATLAYGNINTDKLQQDSEVLLQVIVAQDGLLVERARGIYSFSHLAWQEYFAARNIVDNYQYQALKELAIHSTDERWRNVFLLMVSMLSNVDELLVFMRNEIFSLVASDEKIQTFLRWLHQKSTSVSIPYQAVAVRAFYLVWVGRIFKDKPQGNFIYDFDCKLVGDIPFHPNFAVDEFLGTTLSYALELDFSFENLSNDTVALDHAHALRINFDEALDLVAEPEFKQVLLQLKKQLPNTESHPHKFRHWWIINGKVWTEKLRATIIKYRNFGHDWQFNQQQLILLQQYYNGNKLLWDCLERSVNVTPAVKQNILDNLLLAIASIE